MEIKFIAGASIAVDELKSKLKRCRRIIRGPVHLDMLGNYCVTVTRTDDIDNVINKMEHHLI